MDLRRVVAQNALEVHLLIYHFRIDFLLLLVEHPLVGGNVVLKEKFAFAGLDGNGFLVYFLAVLNILVV